MTFIYYILSVFAIWRIAYMITKEDGPFNIFTNLQNFLYKINIQFFIKLTECFYCLSIWISAIFSVFLANNILEFILYTLSLSTLSIIVEKYLDE